MDGYSRAMIAVVMPLLGSGVIGFSHAARGQDQEASLEVATRTDVEIAGPRGPSPQAATHHVRRHAAGEAATVAGKPRAAAKFGSDFAITDYPMADNNQPALSLKVDTDPMRFSASSPLPKRLPAKDTGQTYVPDKLPDGSTSASIQEYEQKSGMNITLPLLRIANPEPQ